MISVIITTYNSSKTLAKTLASIRRNPFQDYEIIVVDDASRDDTAETVKNQGVKYARLESNRGTAGDAFTSTILAREAEGLIENARRCDPGYLVSGLRQAGGARCGDRGRSRSGSAGA